MYDERCVSKPIYRIYGNLFGIEADNLRIETEPHNKDKSFTYEPTLLCYIHVSKLLYIIKSKLTFELKI